MKEREAAQRRRERRRGGGRRSGGGAAGRRRRRRKRGSAAGGAGGERREALNVPLLCAPSRAPSLCPCLLPLGAPSLRSFVTPLFVLLGAVFLTPNLKPSAGSGCAPFSVPLCSFFCTAFAPFLYRFLPKPAQDRA